MITTVFIAQRIEISSIQVQYHLFQYFLNLFWMEHCHTVQFSYGSGSVEKRELKVINRKCRIQSKGYLLQKRQCLRNYVCSIYITFVSAKVPDNFFFPQQTSLLQRIVCFQILFLCFLSYTISFFPKMWFINHSSKPCLFLLLARPTFSMQFAWTSPSSFSQKQTVFRLSLAQKNYLVRVLPK